MSSPNILTVPAPAKLNLFLHITGQRADGYHNLQTVFQILDYGDSLTFEKTTDGQIRLEPSSAAFSEIPQQDNLIVRAAKLLQEHSQCALGTAIHCDKQLPMGAGLGGGSSNAASALVALNHLWGTQLSTADLAQLGVALGADVPVFVEGHSAWGEGIGEDLSPLKLPESWFLVIIPPCEVSTVEIFKTKELTRNTSPITIAAFLEGGGHNDCQPVVEKRYPEVKNALDWLGQYSPCQMTGTGSAIFATFPTEREASEPLKNLPATLKGFVARGVNRSPLLDSIDEQAGNNL